MLNGGGNQTRDFVSVYDVVRACIRALRIPAERCDGFPMNLGSGQCTSVRQLALDMIQIAKKTVSTEDVAARPGDVLHSMANIERISRVLDWKPRYSLVEGLTEMLEK